MSPAYCWPVLALVLASLTRRLHCLTLEKFEPDACLALDDDVIKYHVPYHVCTDLCRGHDDCRAISFWPKLSTCRLNMADTGALSADQTSCMFSKKADWTQKRSECSADSCSGEKGCRVECGEDVCYDQGCSPYPTTITKGDVLGSSTATGSTAIYRCDAGYLMWGNTTMTCGPDGWDGDQPKCLVYMYSPEYLVDGPNGVPDGSLIASSVWDTYLHGTASFFSPMYARLNTQHNGIDGTGAWSALVNDANQFIQVQFANTKEVVAVALQGRNNPSAASWVTSFKVAVGTSCGGGGNNNQFTVVSDSSGVEKIFDGNSDKDTVVLQALPEPTMALCLRIIPVTWNGHISLRFDVLGI